MSNYVKSVNFTAKDTLPTGNAGKVVRGAELDTEYSAIAVAISTKADTTSPSFTGTPLAPTATAGTNTTQLATTAFVADAVQTTLNTALSTAYPVGSVYINASNATNPGTLLGFGTWAAFGTGRMLVGFNSGDPLFDTAEETGGSKDAIVVSHTHTATSTVTDPGHSHAIRNENQGFNNSTIQTARGDTTLAYTASTNSATTNITVATSVASTGSSGTNANLPPYIVVYMWKRTA